MRRYESNAEPMPAVAAGADAGQIIFYGVDRSGPSFEARVFVNADRASAETPCTAPEGFAGIFTVFGHGGCVGGPGHCDPDIAPDPDFELRQPQGLPPINKALDLSKSMVDRLRTNDTVTITVVALEPSDDGPTISEALEFDSWRLTIYEP
jgi:hypothetical protein